MTGKALWHLFPSTERYKLDTFLAGGLWCAELGSILNFENDVEGTHTYGTFVSCWHVNLGDPSERAWEIFGGAGNGFAIRTSSNKLQALAGVTTTDRISALCAEVVYLGVDEVSLNPAFDVRDIHNGEEEFRFALTLKTDPDIDDASRRRVIRDHCPLHCSGRQFTRPIKQITLSDDGFDQALIVPIEPKWFFEEFLVGPLVSEASRQDVERQLNTESIRCGVRYL